MTRSMKTAGMALLVSALLGCGSVASITRSAEQGDASAQNSLGTLYALGDGVQQNYGEAVKWFRKSADQGNADGQYSLGMAYFSGLGVGRNESEAVKWFRKSAEQGNIDARERLRELNK